MKILKLTLLFAIVATLGFSTQAQTISYSGQLGYAITQGDAFTDADGNRLSSFGISYEADLLYFPGLLDDRLGLGVSFVGSALFGKNSEEELDIGIYGLSLYGVKGMYRVLPVDRSFSPYGALGLGVSVFETPEMTYGNDVVIPADKSYSLGLRPEIGLDLGGFVISASYFVPMQYDVSSDLGTFKGSAGSLTIGVGYRGYINW